VSYEKGGGGRRGDATQFDLGYKEGGYGTTRLGEGRRK